MAALLAALTREPSWRSVMVAACGSAACTLLVVVLFLVGGARATGHATREPGARRPDARLRYDADVFARSPGLRKAFNREWLAMHTNACEYEATPCTLQATNLLREAGFGPPGRPWQLSPADAGATMSWIDGFLRVAMHDRPAALAQDVPWIVLPGQSYSFSVWVRVPEHQLPARGRLSLRSVGDRETVDATARFVARGTGRRSR